MRPIWSGSVSFGLVNIPVRLLTATDENSGVKFHFLHEKDLSPVGYAKVCKAEGIELRQDDIVRGYEYERGQYVVMTDEDFEAADVRASKTIELLNFVSADEIDVKYFEKPYYLEPDKGTGPATAYALLVQALDDAKKVGVAKYVLRNREHLAVLKPDNGVLLLEQIRYASELRSADGLNLPEVKVSEKELEFAKQLIDQRTSDWTPNEYHDTYTEAIQRVIDEKVQGTAVKPKGEAPSPTEVTDLMAALKASLGQAEGKEVA